MAIVKRKRKYQPRGIRGDLRHRWNNMHSRCYKETHESFNNFGGRGIVVCPEWHDFQSFYEWSLNNGFSKELRLGRINMDGNYEPGNCKYFTAKEQSNNHKNNRIETYHGTTDTMSNLVRQFGKNGALVTSRLSRGWSFEEAMDGKPKRQKLAPPEKAKRRELKTKNPRKISMLTQIEHNGKKLSVKQWCEETGLSKGILIYRLQYWDEDYDSCFNTPVRVYAKNKTDTLIP